MRRVQHGRGTPFRCWAPMLLLIPLIGAACGGVESPHLAVKLPREARGPYDSPTIHSAFAVQGALNLPASQTTIQTYLGKRYAGDWIVNNGKTAVLDVGVVHLTDSDQTYAKRHIHLGSHARIKFLNEKFSVSQLNSFLARMSNYIEGHTGGRVLAEHPFLGFGVSPPDNAVKFTVSKVDAAYWIPRLQPLLPYDAFVVQYSSIRRVTALRKRGP